MEWFVCRYMNWNYVYRAEHLVAGFQEGNQIGLFALECDICGESKLLWKHYALGFRTYERARQEECYGNSNNCIAAWQL